MGNLNLFTALSLGFIGAMLPGPILSAIFTDILQLGFKRSLKTILYCFIAETTIAFFIIQLFSYMSLPERFFSIISLIGAGVLLWFSKSLWKIKSIEAENQISFNFSKICLLTLTNGLFWIYWITVAIPLTIEMDKRMMFGKYFFLAGEEVGWLIGTFLLAFIFSKFRPLLIKPKIIGAVFKVFALTFIFFAFQMVYKGIQTF